ncbi:MAG: hypothetical protein O4807_17155 [Trichodesmium sp. St19_bin2]|nr:hypothetical protein [Trichodesmium sp. St5_bin8]MDE5104619.1 hypothetical protein [Trichodesmium sp. St19_bin2]
MGLLRVCYVLVTKLMSLDSYFSSLLLSDRSRLSNINLRLVVRLKYNLNSQCLHHYFYLKRTMINILLKKYQSTTTGVAIAF